MEARPEILPSMKKKAMGGGREVSEGYLGKRFEEKVGKRMKVDTVSSAQ